MSSTDFVRAERDARERAAQLRDLAHPKPIPLVQPFLRETAKMIVTQAAEIEQLRRDLIMRSADG